MTHLEPTRAWRMIDEVVAVMRHEEAVTFPRARADGVPAETIDALVCAHDHLRALARAAHTLGVAPGAEFALPEDAAIAIAAFATAYDEHVRTEAKLLSIVT